MIIIKELMRLQDKVALITGAGRGIGLAEARLFAKEGATVAIADVLEHEGGAITAEISNGGGQAIFVSLDVTSVTDWTVAVDVVTAQFGKLDILVNNAGIFQRTRVEETSSDDWDQVMSVNAKGPFLGTRAAIPVMKDNGGGSIVNISSTNGLVGTPVSTAYNASKAAVHLLTKTTAVQYAKDGIRSNSVHPGPIDTAMLDLAIPKGESRDQRINDMPMCRIGTPDEVAYGVLFLASDESSYMTGGELVIDGGVTATAMYSDSASV